MNVLNLNVGDRFVDVSADEWAGMSPADRRRAPWYVLEVARFCCTDRSRTHLTVKDKHGNSRNWCIPFLAPVTLLTGTAEAEEAA